MDCQKFIFWQAALENQNHYTDNLFWERQNLAELACQNAVAVAMPDNV